MGTTIAPEKILKELSDLWVDSAKQEQAGDGAGVLRACSMTLLVLAEASEDTQALGETIAALMPEHPARAIVVRLSGDGQRALAERVYSQCWMPFGQRRQICCEQVEITASDAALTDLRSVVLPLLVPDLPLIVWCRSARLPELRDFWPIASMAQKLVVDSSAGPNPAGAMSRAAAIAASGIVLGDLSWTRVTRWREMLAQIFENLENVARIGSISTIEVDWGGTRYAPAQYLGAWVRDSLAKAGNHPSLRFAKTGDEDALRLRLSGDGVNAELERQDDRIVATLNGESQCANMPQPTDYLLMREELGIVRRDPVFEATLASAAALVHPTET